MIGIDIGNNFIKVCKIVNVDKKDISVYSAMQNVSRMDDKQKQITIKNLVNKINVTKDKAFLAVGGSDIVNREVVLSKLKAKSENFKSLIFKEVKDSVNEDLFSMYTSCAITREFSDKEVCVMFSAVHRQKVKNTISLLKEIDDIQVAGVTMESLALANSFVSFGPEYKESEGIVLLNIGRDVTNVVVLNNKKVVFVKDIDFGGQNITKDIANIYAIPERLAEEIKVRVDLREKISFNIKNVLKKSVSILVEEIFRIIEYCISRQFIFVADRIIITGGGALTDELDVFIGETLGINTEKWNPLIGNNIVGYSAENYGLFISVALGLALEK